MLNFSFALKFGLLVILGLVVVFILEPLEPSTISTPFCLGLVLMAISLRQSPLLVLATSLVFCCLTIYALTHFRHFEDVGLHPMLHPYFWLFQRLGLFLVVSSMAVYLAHYRTATDRTLTHIQDILSKLPAPVVISDPDGFITYTNDALKALFDPTDLHLVGKRYIDFLMPDIQEGKAVRYYAELFHVPSIGNQELDLRPFGSPIKMNARFTCVGNGAQRLMITVLSDSETALVPELNR